MNIISSRFRFFIGIFTFSFVTQAGTLGKITFDDHVNKSDHIVVGTVDTVESRFETNRYGDRLIVSTVKLDVQERLRGPSVSQLSFDLEGGQVGDVRLEVSDLPALKKGERGVFFLKQSADGKLIPQNRGLGIQRTDWKGQLKDSRMNIEELKTRIKSVAK